MSRGAVPLLAAVAAAVALLATCAHRPEVPVSAEGLHRDCSTSACASGQVCREWCGIAGCSAGPRYHTCEIPCASDGDCPTPYRCTTIVDGPGRVCSKAGEVLP